MLLKYFTKNIFNRALGGGHTNQSLMHKYTFFLILLLQNILDTYFRYNYELYKNAHLPFK